MLKRFPSFGSHTDRLGKGVAKTYGKAHWSCLSAVRGDHYSMECKYMGVALNQFSCHEEWPSLHLAKGLGTMQYMSTKL